MQFSYGSVRPTRTPLLKRIGEGISKPCLWFPLHWIRVCCAVCLTSFLKRIGWEELGAPSLVSAWCSMQFCLKWLCISWSNCKMIYPSAEQIQWAKYLLLVQSCWHNYQVPQWIGWRLGWSTFVDCEGRAKEVCTPLSSLANWWNLSA